MAGSVELLALQLARMLQPLQDRLAAGEVRVLFAELGMRFPAELDGQAGLIGALEGIGGAAARLAEIVPELVTAIEDEDVAETVRLGSEALSVVATLVPDLTTAGDALAAIGAGGLPGVDQADLEAFAAELPQRLLEYLVVSFLEGYHPIVLRVLTLLGIVELVYEPGDPDDDTKPPFTGRRLRLDRLGQLIDDPAGLVHDQYAWGEPAFDGAVLLERLHAMLFALGIPATYAPDATPPAVTILLLRISPRTDVSPPGLELALELSVPAGFDVAIPILVPGLDLRLALAAAAEAGLSVLVQPTATVTLEPPQGELSGTATAEVIRTPVAPRTELELLGVPGGSGLRAGSISLGLTTGFRWDIDAGRATGDFGVAGAIENGRLTLTMAGADGFLATLVGGLALEADFDLGVGWSTSGGFAFTGSGALEIQLPVHVALGPIELTALTMSLLPENGAFPIRLTGNVSGALGPLTAVIEGVGLRATLTFPPGGSGNLGPADLAFAFQPPAGVGLSLDAGVVKGGGYLFIDAERGEYAGALELMFADFVALTAIGLITTKMPDGSSGFSLLIIITAEFGTGLQLGFGFTLLGVGGLVGLNRSMNLQPLVDGIRTGSVDSILFPTDVVANAPKIISDLRAIFPPEEGTFLIGPMAKLGWGTPTLVSLSLGIIIEIPGNIAILGVLEVALPGDDAAVLVLKVSFVGAIEFDKQRIWFFATLFESRILAIPLEGDMGLLVAYGAEPNFVVSVGGFHPRFSAPPLPFPAPRRIGVSLVNESYARVRIEGYFAVTSNTVQFGARAEVFFGLDEINVDGDISFDALFQFSPFAFIIEISASFSVKVFGIGLFSVRVHGTLEGPTPYRVRGEGSISLLFFDISVDFDVSWGEAQQSLLPPISVLPLARAEFEKDDVWAALPPPASNLLVSLRAQPETAAGLVLHPLGTLRVSQRFVPLDLRLDKVGAQRPDDVDRLTVTVTGAGLAQAGIAQEQFAPAQFQDFGDAERVSAPAYGPETSGVEVAAAGAQLRSRRMVRRVVRYEEIIIDANFKRFAQRFTRFPGALFDFFLGRNAVTRNELSAAHKAQLSPFADRVATLSEGYAVVSQADNTVYAGAQAPFSSEAGARDFLARAAKDDPNLCEQLHVVPSFEVTP